MVIFSATQEKGCEVFSEMELKSRFNVISQTHKSFVSFETTLEKAAEISYSSQSIKRILIHISSGTFKQFDDLLDILSENFKDSLNTLSEIVNFSSFKVECERFGEHTFNSVDLEQNLSKLLKDEIKKEINLSNPDISFYIQIQEEAFVLGLDFAGRDLSKRQHLIFNNPNNLKGTLAYNLLLFSNYKQKDVILDPFSLAGTICIEAAISSSGMPVNYYTKNFNFLKKEIYKKDFSEILKKIDSNIKSVSQNFIYSCDSSFNNVSAQKKNAKIAGVEKFISFSRKNVEDLDLKFFDKDIDLIISKIIEPSKSVPEHVCIDVYSYLFKNAKEILSKSGRMAVIVRNPSLFLEVGTKNNFILEKQHEVWQGKQAFYFCLLKINKSITKQKNT